MIETLRIQNFKGWRDTGEIQLAPLTVFFGENSSGKSSIGQFLMMLKQSVESSDRKTVFFTGNEGTAVDLGAPLNIIYEQNPENVICFSYDWSSREKLILKDPSNKVRRSSDHIKFSCEVRISDAERQMLEVKEYKYTIDPMHDDDIEIGLKKREPQGKGKKGYELTFNNFGLSRSRGRAWDITSPVRFYGFPDEAVAYYQNADFLQDINFYHKKLFDSVYYLGPLRKQVRRFYNWNGGLPESVGYLGQDAIQAILAAEEEDRMINLGNHKRRKRFKLLVAEMLKNMSLIEEFTIEKISGKRQDYDVKVRTKGSRKWVDIPDVGMGVSQVLPVIVELFYAPPGSVIIMEQPALHLHPKAQAALADVMIDAIHAKEDFKDRNIQLLIETHSEHFLRRLQRRMAEGSLKPEEFSAFFANNDRSPATLEPLQVDEYGNIANWPKNFFGDIAGDIFAQTNAALNKRKKEAHNE